MRKCIYKKMLIILLIVTIFSVNLYTISFAGRTSEFLNRTGKSVSTNTGPSGNTGGKQPTTTTNTQTSNDITITEINGIEGYVYEDRPVVVEGKNIWSSKELTTANITTNRKLDDGEAIENVVVELVSGNNVVATTMTNKDGYYSFSGIGVGSYNLRFYYGLVNANKYLPDENLSEYILPVTRTLNDNVSYEEIKNIIKYNAQDYQAVIAGNSFNSRDYFTRKIIESEKAYSQVYILIDCSPSVQQNNEKVFKLEMEAAREAINNLLPDDSENDNIAIGIVGFFNDIEVLKELTNYKQDLLDCLDNIILEAGYLEEDVSHEVEEVNNFINWDTEPYGTNIGLALEKTKKLFITDENYRENSNRNIILLSDGYPTAHKTVEQLYQEDDEATLDSAYERITAETQNDLKATIDDGINLIPIIAEPEDITSTDYDEYARTYIDWTFKDNNTQEYLGYYKEISLTHEQEYKDYIANDVVNIIKSEFEEGKIISEITEEGILNEINRLASRDGENEERRKIVNNYFSIIDNQKATWFNIAEKLTGDLGNDLTVVQEYRGGSGGADTYNEFIKEFTSKTFMYVETTIPYEMTSYREDEEGNVYYYTPSGTKIFKKEDYDNIFTNSSKYTNENLVLEKRSGFKLELEKKVTGLRITLSDGTILKEEITNDFTDVLNGNNMLTIPITMDEELMHGATLELEYTIRIKNLSNTNIQTGSQISIVDYFNLNDNTMQYRPDTQLLSEPDKTNSYYLWNAVDKTYLEDKVSEDVYDSLNDGQEYLVANYYVSEVDNDNFIGLDSNGKPVYRTNPVIGKDGYIDVKIAGTTTLSAALETDDLTYSNTAEILTYSNMIGRRIDYEKNTPEVEAGLEEYIKFLSDYPDETVAPGNYRIDPNNIGPDEEDDDTATEVTIIPPLGEKIKRYALPIILGLVFVAGLIFIKRKVLK
ncbi:MAG: hypothetical protein IKT41_00495 [Clostridia bacterium]|nr:hypothetical protein [Clostridia bacterium]